MANRLVDATSPYLLQHKDNPVDWREWGDEAFVEARRRDVPVLLSVGYAACHWCHVMAHESFEDPETADLMNRLFVNVKVDREERPDVDSIYMEAVQAMTGRGGWPMTVWLDHDQRPFYAGTYFPPTPRHGMPSFTQVIRSIADAWEARRGDVADQAGRVTEVLFAEPPPGDAVDLSVPERSYPLITSGFDTDHGGFGRAPKFPQQPVLEYLLRVRKERWAAGADIILNRTLEAMARGGIHDQIGGGFARYSVDARWLVPHFEKMLYDNAQLARIYLWSGVELGRDDFLIVARSTLDYMMRDLGQPEGGFSSAEDADSEGIEGKFYVWTPDEIRSALGADAAGPVIDYFGVTEVGNFEGSNILHIPGSGDPPAGLEEARVEMLEVRGRRVRPSLDDKVVTAWNGLAIRALAEAGAALDRPDYLERAETCARFVFEHLVVDGRLMRSWRDGGVSGPGFLDDHAAMAVGLFSLFAATGAVDWHERAVWLLGELDRFAKPSGGFYSTPDDGRQLLKRPVDLTDNPSPSGHALAAEALLLASLYGGDGSLRQRCEVTLAAATSWAERHPTMIAHHLSVLHSLAGPKELAIVGSRWPELSSVFWHRFRPHIALAVAESDQPAVPLLADRATTDSTLAYLCEGFVCDLPTDDPEVLERLLAGSG